MKNQAILTGFFVVISFLCAAYQIMKIKDSSPKTKNVELFWKFIGYFLLVLLLGTQVFMFAFMIFFGILNTIASLILKMHFILVVLISYIFLGGILYRDFNIDKDKNSNKNGEKFDFIDYVKRQINESSITQILGMLIGTPIIIYSCALIIIGTGNWLHDFFGINI